MGRWKSPLGRVACPYAAEPESSNLQRLPIYGVSPRMASRNFRAHRAVESPERYLNGEHIFSSPFSGSSAWGPQAGPPRVGTEVGEGEGSTGPDLHGEAEGEDLAEAFKIV